MTEIQFFRYISLPFIHTFSHPYNLVVYQFADVKMQQQLLSPSVFALVCHMVCHGQKTSGVCFEHSIVLLWLSSVEPHHIFHTIYILLITQEVCELSSYDDGVLMIFIWLIVLIKIFPLNAQRQLELSMLAILSGYRMYSIICNQSVSVNLCMYLSSWKLVCVFQPVCIPVGNSH